MNEDELAKVQVELFDDNDYLKRNNFKDLVRLKAIFM